MSSTTSDDWVINYTAGSTTAVYPVSSATNTYTTTTAQQLYSYVITHMSDDISDEWITEDPITDEELGWIMEAPAWGI